jgi:hypothetical protein
LHIESPVLKQRKLQTDKWFNESEGQQEAFITEGKWENQKNISIQLTFYACLESLGLSLFFQLQVSFIFLFRQISETKRKNNECCVVLCCVVLWYGQPAQTFYMCLESLVGCMKENLGSFTYFSADGTILRRFAKYFWPDGVFEEFWSTFKYIEAILKPFWYNV